MTRRLRKIVTVPGDVAERIERARIATGEQSDQAIYLRLIVDGLKNYDSPTDLEAACRAAHESKMTSGTIIDRFLANHPLVVSVTVDDFEIIVDTVRGERFTIGGDADPKG